MKESIRKLVRLIILETNSTVGYKMIFLAGLPGGGKTTLLNQLGIANQFTNCNIDNFFEPKLKSQLGTMDLHTPTDRYTRLKRRMDREGYKPTQEELEQFKKDHHIVSQGASLFGQAHTEFKSQIREVCTVGSNFIIDGTSANYRSTMQKKEDSEDLGYDCAMIFVDIDTETSQERNIARGQKGGRSIYNSIIYRQGQSMPQNLSLIHI